MKKLVISILLLAAAGGGYYYYTQSQKSDIKPTVVQAMVTQGDITEQVQATGTLESVRTYPVGSQVSGTVKALYADFNDVVKKGMILAEIDPSLLQAQVDLQQANYDRQVGEIANQEVQLEDAKKQLERTQAMFEKGLSTQQSLDQAQLTVKTRTTQVESAKKSLLQNKAQLEQAKLNVSYTIIRAPDDGVVVNRSVDVGQTVQASTQAPTFFTIATDLRTLKLNAGVDEAEIGKVQRGMPVTFTVDSYQGMTFRGTVSAVRLNAQNTSNVVTYPVWIDAPNPDLRLRPSMTATVHIITNAVSNVVRIPNAALRFRPTSDMYTALGLTPPAAPARGEGRRGGAPGSGPAGTDSSAATPGAPQARGGGQAAPGQPANGAAAGNGRRTQNGQGQAAQGQAQGGRTGGRGFGGNANMSPEERQRMLDQFRANGGGRGGRGGAGGFAGGQGSGRNGRGGNAAAPLAPEKSLAELNADKIDDLFQVIPSRTQPGTVWKWDEATKKLTDVRVTIGLADPVSNVSQLVSGDIKPGDQVVTNILVPQTSAQRTTSLLGGTQNRGGGFGPTPGGVGGDRGFGGGGGGGGGGRGGGRN